MQHSFRLLYRRKPNQIVYDQKNRTLDKEEIVHHRVEAYSCRKKQAMPCFRGRVVFIHDHFQADQHQRKKSHNIMKMIERKIRTLEAGECIQKGPGHCVPRCSGKPFQIHLRGIACNQILQYHYRTDQIWCHPLRKQRNQPEERTPEFIETERLNG